MGSLSKGGGGGSSSRGVAELNYHMRYEHKEVRDGVVGEGQGLSEEDESKIGEVAVTAEVRNVGREVLVQPQTSLQRQPSGSGSVVRWERFLPLRSLKVLLVENDNSTRHVVSALLRNCSYEVVAVSNGVHAWKILQDLTNHIDIILTEVVMPCVSGIGLLCKIMNHKTCKHIPVIMMSSHDAMGIVFKCLSKGAVDFLVKPIRKNELKNLWQHVWRRCHSSSGSGSESGIQTRKSVRSKCINDSDNNTGSNDEDEDDSVGLNARDGSDNGSGTQSSWTKRAVEVDSPRLMSPWNQLAEPQDSTCAQVIHSKSESIGKEWMPIGAKKECQEDDDQLMDNVPMGKDLVIGIPRNADVQQEQQSEKVEIGLSEVPNGKPTSKVLEIKDKSKPASDDIELPSLELSLKRLRDVATSAHDDRNVLRRSDLSAFSRYNNAYNSPTQTPTAVVGSCSPVGNSSEAMKTDSMYNQRSNESSNNYDMGSTTKNVFTKPPYPSAFQPVQNTSTCPPLPQKANEVVANTVVAQPSRGGQQQVQVQHHHHYHHHHHHHVHNLGDEDNEDLALSMGGMGGSALQCGSSNMIGGTIEGTTTGNFSLNGSASGSNHGSSRQKGSSNDMNAGGMNIESDNGVVGKSGVGGSGSGSGSGVDQNRSAQRVAALTKFRQKRKERCFERKVRYQSRKRLAEQRPRVRGQFVRQRVYENASGDADC
ncbi:hypothetical protein ACHQM5_021644 [Ranunculus cassubicifolius]